MSLSRTVSEINGDFSRKSQNFPTPVYFCATIEWVLLVIGYRRWGSKKQNDGATGSRKTFDDDFSRVDTIHQRDRRTPDDSKDRAYA